MRGADHRPRERRQMTSNEVDRRHAAKVSKEMQARRGFMSSFASTCTAGIVASAAMTVEPSEMAPQDAPSAGATADSSTAGIDAIAASITVEPNDMAPHDAPSAGATVDTGTAGIEAAATSMTVEPSEMTPHVAPSAGAMSGPYELDGAASQAEASNSGVEARGPEARGPEPEQAPPTVSPTPSLAANDATARLDEEVCDCFTST